MVLWSTAAQSGVVLDEGNVSSVLFIATRHTKLESPWKVAGVTRSLEFRFLLLLINLRGLPDGTVAKNLPASSRDTRDAGSIPGCGRSPGVGKGNPLQSASLENPMNRRAWQGGQKESDTAKWLSTHTCTHIIWTQTATYLTGGYRLDRTKVDSTVRKLVYVGDHEAMLWQRSEQNWETMKNWETMLKLIHNRIDGPWFITSQFLKIKCPGLYIWHTSFQQSHMWFSLDHWAPD